MSRLTHMGEQGPYWDKAVFSGKEDAEDMIINRLADFENFGLEPEQIKDMVENAETSFLTWFESKYGIPVSQLMSFLEANKEGRLIVLPCQVGDTVWVKFLNGIEPYTVDRFYTIANGQTMVRLRHYVTETLRLSIDKFGENIFLTEEKAEKML